MTRSPSLGSTYGRGVTYALVAGFVAGLAAIVIFDLWRRLK